MIEILNSIGGWHLSRACLVDLDCKPPDASNPTLERCCSVSLALDRSHSQSTRWLARARRSSDPKYKSRFMNRNVTFPGDTKSRGHWFNFTWSVYVHVYVFLTKILHPVLAYSAMKEENLRYLLGEHWTRKLNQCSTISAASSWTSWKRESCDARQHYCKRNLSPKEPRPL